MIAAGAGATNAEKAQATTANHGVCIVGWDDTYSANNFVTKPSADGAFLCRNSWGSYGRYVNSTIGGQSVPLETCTTSSGQDMGQVFYQNGQIYLIRNGQVAGLGVDKVTLTKSTTDGSTSPRFIRTKRALPIRSRKRLTKTAKTPRRSTATSGSPITMRPSLILRHTRRKPPNQMTRIQRTTFMRKIIWGSRAK